MLKLLKSFFANRAPDTRSSILHAVELPTEVVVDAAHIFPISPDILQGNAYPLFDWITIQKWIEALDPEYQAQAWAQFEIAWLQHMRAALGSNYSLVGEGDAMLLSTLEPNVELATLGFINKTLQRIIRLLDGVAQKPEWGKDILVIFDDDESYYKYVSLYYPEEGEFARSGGMYINNGCGHFVTVKADLRAIEPVIAHELTHGCVGHLPLPTWLNEGLAVNTEHRLSPPAAPMFTPQQMHEKHMDFWGHAEIQEFWSGKSFFRSDDGNMLSYDLGRIMVDQLSGDWPRFIDFVKSVQFADAGAAALAAHFNMELGSLVCALLEREIDPAWSPDLSMSNTWADHE